MLNADDGATERDATSHSVTSRASYRMPLLSGGDGEGCVGGLGGVAGDGGDLGIGMDGGADGE
eukprot:3946398-Prymnesium_polylepis.2